MGIATLRKSLRQRKAVLYPFQFKEKLSLRVRGSSLGIRVSIGFKFGRLRSRKEKCLGEAVDKI